MKPKAEFSIIMFSFFFFFCRFMLKLVGLEIENAFVCFFLFEFCLVYFMCLVCLRSFALLLKNAALASHFACAC